MIQNNNSNVWSEAFLFFKEKHKDQKYGDGLEYWHHLYTVASTLQSAIDECKEFDDQTKKDLLIAATGHDSLEDTDTTKEEIKNLFGQQVLDFIKAMTNDVGDHDTSSYEQKMLNNPEEIRLLKMCDTIDNYTRICYRAKDNGPKFLKEKIMPIMENMTQKILKTEFTNYPTTASFLKQRLRCAYTLATTALDLAE